MAYQYSNNRRPWSPVAEDNRGAPGGTIDAFLAHSSHGWVADDFSIPRRAAAGNWDDGYDYSNPPDRASLARHRANMRLGNAAYDPEYDAENSRFNPRFGTSRRQAREPSEVSVEALDLADYAQTLRWHSAQAQNDHHAALHPFSRELGPQGQSQPWSNAGPTHQTFSPPSLPYPPRAGIASPPIGVASPPPGSLMDRPFSALSRDTNLPPPSLVSGGATSHSSHTNSIFLNQNVNRTMRRPFSLPAEYMAPPMNNWGAGARASPPLTGSTGRRAANVEPTLDYGIPEADVSTFPPWARGWYDRDNGPQPQKKFTSPPQSPADDAIFGPYIHPSQIRSQQDLPWNSRTLPLAGKVPGADHAERADEVPEEVKEERMRMLEREFGNDSGKRGRKDADPNEDTRIGSVDPKGSLITEGPKKRITLRWFQAIFALATAGSGIYGALVSH